MPEDDEEFIVMRAKLAIKNNNIYSAKSWMVTAKLLYPSNFYIQFEAYCMEKETENVAEAAESFSTLLSTQQHQPEIASEIAAIADALKSTEPNFLSQMFDKLSSDIQLTILKTSLDNSDNSIEHCRLLVLLLKKFPNLGVDSLVKTVVNSDKFFYDTKYARLLVVETLPLLSSLESPRLLQRLVIKAIDFYNTYVYEDREHDIPDPWQRMYGVLELLGRQLKWDFSFLNYCNTINKEAYFQKLISLIQQEDCRQLLFCGTVFFLRLLYEQRATKTENILLEAFSDPDIPPSIRRMTGVEVTGVCAQQFLVAAGCWDLLHSNGMISREFKKLLNQLQMKPWEDSFIENIAIYHGKYDEALSVNKSVSISSSIVKVSVTFAEQQYAACLEYMLIALSNLPSAEGTLESDLIVGGTHRHLHFLNLTKTGIVHYFTTLLIRMLLKVAGNSDIVFGHLLVLMQLAWPHEEPLFIHIIETIKSRGKFTYHLFPTYIINIDILEEISYLWNEHGSNIAIDIVPNSQQHLGQRRMGTRGADKGVKEDFKQAIKAQILKSNESIINLIIQFITQEHSNLLHLCNNSMMQ